MMTTEIWHSHGRAAAIANGWTHLQYGHNDVRCTGGDWFYKGDKEEALQLLKARTDKLNELRELR
jgi:hypothetical protein